MTLEGENLTGVSGTSRAKPPLAARDSWKGQSPEGEAPHTGPSVHDGRSCRVNVMRVRSLWKHFDHLLRGEHSEEVNPMSAVGTKQARPGVEGRNPSRG